MEIMSMKSFAKTLNDLTFTYYYNRLKLLALNRVEWEFPKDLNMEEKWVENFLFKKGYSVYFDDKYRGRMVAECALEGVNSYDDPVKIRPVGLDIPDVVLTPGVDCVLIKNNDLMLPTDFVVRQFAYRLADVTRTIDVNVRAQKTPALIIGSDKQKLSMKNTYSQWDGNEPVIYGDKTMNADMIKVLNTAAPIVFPQLHEHKQNILCEFLTFLGINNANTDKRERLITDEVKANDTLIDLSAESFLKSRQRATEQIKDIFGDDIKVKLRAKEEEEIEYTEEVDDQWQDTQSNSEN